MARKTRVTNVTEDAGRILFLTYGQDAVEMAELRCRELAEGGDHVAVSDWRTILKHVRQLAASNPKEQSRVN
jgi:hypothetical protein